MKPNQPNIRPDFYRPPINRFIKDYGKRLGSLAVNTARIVHHEVCPPKPQAPPMPEVIFEPEAGHDE